MHDDHARLVRHVHLLFNNTASKNYHLLSIHHLHTARPCYLGRWGGTKLQTEASSPVCLLFFPPRLCPALRGAWHGPSSHVHVLPTFSPHHPPPNPPNSQSLGQGVRMAAGVPNHSLHRPRHPLFKSRDAGSRSHSESHRGHVSVK